ncbi:hypothetical protein ACFC09_18890 [Streptomyces sp. NPDC056161]|uniref:hypothetical protein n=1 Tax=Streptomyces sp. NPDC056161 TaxID=3345732 RepID=UPI0035D58AA9
MYSAKEQTVDLVGHSMGGLIIRAAPTGYATGDMGNGAPTDVGAQHLVRYSERADLHHSRLRTVRRAGAFPLRYTNNGGAWGSRRDGAAPLRVAMNALYWHSRW